MINMISFSGGRTSAYMTIRLLDDPQYTDDNTIICFANTGKEKEETLKFAQRVDKYIGNKIIWLEYDPINKFKIVNYETASRNGEPFAALIKKRKYVPNVMTRFCTTELKIRVIKSYLASIGIKEWLNIVGIRYDEPRRYNRVKHHVNKWVDWFPLVEWKVEKKDVLEYFKKMPFDLQLKDYEGNCDLCFLKGIKKRTQILKDSPGIANWWIEQEKLTGATFVKDYGVEKLLKRANSQLNELKFEDADFSCYCGD
jgi:3'-phosphoadenosine 5'-phosphosulfate sulfotransferase (PAPS reductase)/FAD synthetase